MNAHQAPVGAYASSALGALTPDVLVGTRLDDGSCEPLPFEEALRELGPTVDERCAGDITLRVVSPVRPVLEPETSEEDELRDALVPALLVQLSVDNRAGARARQAFFGLRGPLATAGRRGFSVDLGDGRTAGAFCLADVTAAAADSLPAALDRASGGSGEIGVLRFNVRARTRRTFGIVVAFWQGGECSHTGLFDGLEDAARYALARFGVLASAASILWLGDDAGAARLAPAPNGHGPWDR